MLWLVLSGVVSMSTAQAPAKTDVTDTQWQFASSKGAGLIVTFRKDGVALFSAIRDTGHWQQAGNLVMFDVNDSIEYRMTVSGNEMTGEWIRLRGPAKGETHQTSLKKL